MKRVRVQGFELEYQFLPSAHPREQAPTLVFLHEGLGSISMWRDFPQRVADACGCPALVYSRQGYGRSDISLIPRTPHYMHDEALLALPELLDALGIQTPILLGHSDGASISLIHAGSAGRPVTGTIVMAPHLFVEEEALAGIRLAVAAYEQADLRRPLAKHHNDVDRVFRNWHGIWLSPEFRDWNIDACVQAISTPILAIQGEDDEYGTLEQIERIARLAPDVELCKLADCRHSPHKDQAQAVIDATASFVARLLDD